MKKLRIDSVLKRLSPSARLDLWAELQHAAWHILDLTDEWYREDERMRNENKRRCGIDGRSHDGDLGAGHQK